MTLNKSKLIELGWVASKKHRNLDLIQEFEKLAFLTAQIWKDEHPDVDLNSQANFEACVLYVTTEMVTAAKAVGGPAGLEITTGGGSQAARLACKRIFTSPQIHS